MSSRSIEAGRGHVSIGIKSRIAEGASRVESDLNQLGKKTLAIGATLSLATASLISAPLSSASDLQETVGKFNVVFGESAGMMSQWADATGQAMGESRESMLGMLSGMQDLLVPMGLMPNIAEGMSQTLTGLAIDLGSFNNMRVSDTFRDLMSAMTGSSEVMKKYGVIVDETAVKQELLAMGLDSKAADNAAKAQARLAIIMRGTTAAQGDAIRTADSHANVVKRLWSTLKDVSGLVGGAFLADMTALVNVAVSGATAVGDFAKNNQDLVRVLGLATLAAGGLGVGLIGVGISAKIAASAVGAVMLASQVASAGAAVAWSSVSAVFTLLTLKSRVTAAVVTTTWSVAAKAISVAWEVASSLVGIAMQGMTALVGAAAIAAPWLAAAATVAVAWFGVDATMATLAVAAAGAWSLSAGTVTAAWTAAAGILTPIALAIGGAYSATAAFITTAWAAVGAAFTGAGLAGVASATMASVAWAALGAVQAALAAEATVSAALTSLAWSAAATVAGVAWSGFTALLSAALAPASLMAAAGFAVSSAWSIAAGVASVAWGAAWAVITGPMLPFIALGAGVLGVTTAMGVGVGVLAAKSVDLGAGFEKAKSMIGGVVSVVTDVFNTLQMALSSGNYATAAQALWAGIRLAFWEGVSGAMSAFSWLFDEGMKMAGRFFDSLLQTTWRIMKAVTKAIMNPFEAAKEIGSAIADLASTATSFNVDGRAAAARAELATIQGILSAEAKRNQNAKDAKKVVEESINQQERLSQKLEEINRLQKAGALTPKQADKAREHAKATIVPGAPGTDAGDDTDVFAEKMKALELEILALEKGETAAERKKLADEGLTKAQIAQIEILNRKKQAIEEAAEAERNASQKRVEQVFKRGEELSEQGASPDQVFERVMNQINIDQEAGRIGKDTAEDARETARGNLDDRMEALKREGKALADALRTPAEILNSKLKEISQLQDVGAISDDTALRAEDKARKEFMLEQQRNIETVRETDRAIEQERARTGPTGSFSAAAAVIIGSSGSVESESLKVQKETAKNTAFIAKQAKKNSAPRFA
ncbi:hypothetical protein LOC71_22295 [Rhodopirellula sp. JC740]|uniref:Tape measure protein n=1 Tax=Rhodopirellula halodulae TaxID=2894198 RepID=A0ABS8NN95_9BACT|nr:hypothetical protein [Rhodopirellula sp. JC740]MCC9645017.1 hypothetical protein [Rhodopirellula sp. JC740]